MMKKESMDGTLRFYSGTTTNQAWVCHPWSRRSTAKRHCSRGFEGCRTQRMFIDPLWLPNHSPGNTSLCTLV